MESSNTPELTKKTALAGPAELDKFSKILTCLLRDYTLSLLYKISFWSSFF